MAMPHRMPKGMASVVPRGPYAAAAQAIIAPVATVHGTERSICPSRMTSIMPVAMMPRNDATFNCCSRYSGDKKLRE
ncbi:hypothetical protein D9M72_527640 [compost metagenome]